jgi:hypothetical protein
MDWILENWYIAIVLLGSGIGIGILIVKFWQLPLSEKQKIVGSFILGLMIDAEKQFQTAEGQARLEVVLQGFYAKCPSWMKSFMSFDKLKEFAELIFSQNKELIESVNEKKQAELKEKEQ